MTDKWTIKRYTPFGDRRSRWVLFAPGITPPKSYWRALLFEHPALTLCDSQSEAIKEIKNIKRRYGGGPR